MNDAEVITRSLEDPSAFADIFRRHGRVVLAYARSRIGDSVGEDIAAKTFLIAFERRDTFDTTFESARPWLFGIAMNLIRHHVRDESIHIAALSKVRFEATGAQSDEPGALDALEAERWRAALIAALHSIPDIDRETFLLAAVGELSYEEIAEVLSIPKGTVRSRVHRARGALRERLRGEVARLGGDEGPQERGPWTSSI